MSQLASLITKVTPIAAGLLLLSACESIPGGSGSIADNQEAMPGEIVRANYVYILDAIRAFDSALSGKKASLAGIPLASSVGQNSLGEASDSNEKLQSLAENHLIVAGPYEFINADTKNGRLEYADIATGERVSVTVRAPTDSEKRGGQQFVVKDLFSQFSLETLSEKAPIRIVKNNYSASVLRPALRQVIQLGNKDDEALLAYFNALPIVERDRVDILGVRALLMMRLNIDRQARLLIEQGIIRHPDASMFLTMAELLFERSNKNIAVPDALSELIRHRFNSREMSSAKKVMQELLSSPVFF